MQNYRYRSSGNSRGCMRQPDSSRELCAGIALDQMPVTMAYVPWTKWQKEKRKKEIQGMLRVQTSILTTVCWLF